MDCEAVKNFRELLTRLLFSIGLACDRLVRVAPIGLSARFRRVYVIRGGRVDGSQLVRLFGTRRRRVGVVDLILHFDRQRVDL